MLGKADKKMHRKDSRVLYSLSLENAEQKNNLLLLCKEAGETWIKAEELHWLLLAQILSAQKQFTDAETIVGATLDRTGKWTQGDLLLTKARIQATHGQFGDAVETYTQLL